jgi:drug/metabolite transporter (DMT)-like permease
MRGSDATEGQRAGLVPAAVDRRTAAPLKGIALMLLAGLFYTLNNAAMKLVLEDIPLGQAILIRGLVVCAPLLLLTRRRGGRPFRRSRFGAQSVCAILSALTVCLFVGSLPYLSLPVAVTVSYTSPLFVILMAPFLLGERIGVIGGCAAVIGFAGVVMIAHPAGGTFSWVILMPLASALFMGLRDIAFRRFLASIDSLSILTFSQVAVALVGLGLALFAWSPMGSLHLLLLVGAGTCFGLGVFFTIESFRHAEASTAAGFRYSGMLWAGLIGFVVWYELPSDGQIIGIPLVAISGLMFLMRNGRARPAPLLQALGQQGR